VRRRRGPAQGQMTFAFVVLVEKEPADLGVCPSIAFRKRGSNNLGACGPRLPGLARLSDE
jgi:hypothetical protein